MPAWITHLATAKKVFCKLNIEDKNSFLFGNIMPDILNNYFVKNTRVHKKYSETHFSKFLNVNGGKYQFPDLDMFFNKYKDKMDNPVVCGCFVHLLTDYYWNIKYRKEYCEDINGKTRLKLANGEYKIDEDDAITKIKHEDFKVFTEYLKKNIIFEELIYTDNLARLCQEVEELPITKDEVADTVRVVNEMIESEEEYKSYNYSICTQEKMNEYFEDSLDFVVCKIESYNQIKT